MVHRERTADRLYPLTNSLKRHFNRAERMCLESASPNINPSDVNVETRNNWYRREAKGTMNLYYLSHARTVLLSPKRADKATRRRVARTRAPARNSTWIMALSRSQTARKETQNGYSVSANEADSCGGACRKVRPFHVWPSLRRSNTRVSAVLSRLFSCGS